MNRIAFLAAGVWLAAGAARADDVGCTSTTFRIFGANDKVCVMAFDDPRVSGVSCHISQARTGGVKGSLGLAEDPSRFAIACRQTGPIALPAKLPEEESVFSESTSLLFKNTKVIRMFDAKRNTLVYVAISKRVIEGSPMNSLSTVPIRKWEGS
ncbi:MAG: CreA family protein [Betaproteobacteria bacterium]